MKGHTMTRHHTPHTTPATRPTSHHTGHVSREIVQRSWHECCRPLHQRDMHAVADLHVMHAWRALWAWPITHTFYLRAYALYVALHTRAQLMKGK